MQPRELDPHRLSFYFVCIQFLIFFVCYGADRLLRKLAERPVINGGFLYLLIALVWWLWIYDHSITTMQGTRGDRYEAAGHLTGLFLFPVVAAIVYIISARRRRA